MFDEKRFRAQMALNGMKMKELASAIGIDESTMYRKISSGGNFTREEINRIIDVLHIDNPMDIFFAQELA